MVSVAPLGFFLRFYACGNHVFCGTPACGAFVLFVVVVFFFCVIARFSVANGVHLISYDIHTVGRWVVVSQDYVLQGRGVVVVGVYHFLSKGVVELIRTRVSNFSNPPTFSVQVIVRITICFGRVQLRRRIIQRVRFGVRTMFASCFRHLPFFKFIRFGRQLDNVAVQVIAESGCGGERYRGTSCQRVWFDSRCDGFLGKVLVGG